MMVNVRAYEHGHASSSASGQSGLPELAARSFEGHLTHPAAEVFTERLGETIHAICRPRRHVQGMSRLLVCRASDISSKR